MAKPLNSIKFPDLPNRYLVAPPITEEVSGAIASFADGANNAPVEDLTVSIVPKQAGSGTPSPSNVRAISGFTKATIKRAGKNLYNNIISADICSNNNGASHTSSDGVLTITPKVDTSASNSGVYFSYSASTLWNAIYMLRAAGLSATLSFDAKASVLPVQMRVGTTGASSYPTLTTDWVRYSTAIPASDAGAICFYANRLAQSSVISIRNVMVSVGDVGAYEPYTADTYEVSFGSAGTVYGGTLDVTTGKLTVTRRIIDLGTFSASYWAVVDAAKGIFRLNLSSTNTGGNPRKIYTGTQVDDPGLSDQYSFGLSNNEATIKASLLDGQYAFGVNGTLTYYRNAACSTAAQIASAMSGVQFVYPLATPIEVNLTPTEVRTLLGANNIWSDTGDATVTYRADTGLYIDKRIAEVQALVLD